jgi:hypothetical protein
MAVELKKFQAEYTKIDATITTAYSERKVAADSEGNTKKLVDGARLAIGDRVQELKSNGDTRTTLAEFLSDAEVKQAYDVAVTALNNFKPIEARKIKAFNDIKGAYEDLVDLAKRIDAEVADRKKKLFEPKSLPDMVKLAKKVRDEIDEEGGLKTESIKDIATATSPKAGALATKFKEDLELEIKKSAKVRANAAAGEILAKFQSRLLKLRWDKVNSLGKAAEAAAAEAMTLAKINPEGAKAKLDAALATAEEMNAIVTDYGAAYKKNESFLKDNPDLEVILKFVSGTTSISNRVLKNIATAQTTVANAKPADKK